MTALATIGIVFFGVHVGARVVHRIGIHGVYLMGLAASAGLLVHSVSQ